MNTQPAYFLIGGNGFLGSAFQAYLREQQIDARVIGRGEISDARSLYFNEDFVSQLPVSSSRNIILDFAYTSVPNTSFTDPVRDFSENLYNINSHLAFAARLPGAAYVYISSGGTIYGNVAEKKPVREDAPNTPLSPYGITKLAAEKYCLMYKEIYGINVRIVRPSNIYGPGQKPFRGQGFVATAIAKIIQQQPIQLFGDGTTVRDYLYVEDFCEGLYSVLEKGENGGVYNLGSETGHTTNEVLRTIREVMPERGGLRIEYLPARPFDVAYNVLDCSRMKKLDPDYRRTGLQTGILQTFEWLQNTLQ